MIHNYITDWFATEEKLEKTQEFWYSLHANSSKIKLFYFACDMKIKVIMEVEDIIS